MPDVVSAGTRLYWVADTPDAPPKRTVFWDRFEALRFAFPIRWAIGAEILTDCSVEPAGTGRYRIVDDAYPWVRVLTAEQSEFSWIAETFVRSKNCPRTTKSDQRPRATSFHFSRSR